MRVMNYLRRAVLAALAFFASTASLSAQTTTICCTTTSGGGTGTVTSVAATTPTELNVVGSPITTSGTLAFSWTNQFSNLVFAAPCSATGTPTFRVLCAADIPSLDPTKITGTAVITSDARLSDARTPIAHAISHASAGSDPVTIAQSQVTNLTTDLAGKQATGNYITALTGDVTAAGPGSAAATLATVNSNVGSFTNASVTVDAKGRITAASSGGASGISTLNTLTGATQTFATGTTGTDFAISSSGTTHTFNMPDASATARGLVSTGVQSFAGVKTFASSPTSPGSAANTERYGAGATTGTSPNAVSIGTNASITGVSSGVGHSVVIGAAATDNGGTSRRHVIIGADASTFTNTTESVVIGYLAKGGNETNVDRMTAVGSQTITDRSEGVALGYKARAAGAGAIVIGANAFARNGFTPQIIIGSSANSGLGPDTAHAIVIGAGGNGGGFNDVLVMGTNAAATADNQVVFGSSARPLTNVYVGNGVTASAPLATSYNATGGSGTNIAGASMVIAGGKGTGNAAGGNVLMRTSPRTSTGTTLQTLADRQVIVAASKDLTESTATSIAEVSLASSTTTGGTLRYTIEAGDGTDFQALRGEVLFAAVNKAGTITTSTSTAVETSAPSSGTLTNAMTVTTGASKIILQLNAVSSLTQTVLRVTYTIVLDGGTGSVTTL